MLFRSQFQLYLINQRKLSPEAINIYISAIKFLYLTPHNPPQEDQFLSRDFDPKFLIP